MQDAVHRRDTEHGLVGVVAREHLVLEMRPQSEICPQLPVVVFAHEAARADEEAARAAGGIDDAVAQGRLHEPHHHTDDVARRAELPDAAGSLEL